MKKIICTLLAAALLGSGGAALAHDDDPEHADPVIQIVSEYETAQEQIDALLELRARVDAMIEQLGSADYAPLERNDINDDVTRLQERLIELGYLDRANGKYDNETVKAVKQFEKVNGLDNDGKASTLDQLILFSDIALNKSGQPATAASAAPETEPAPGVDEPDPAADKPDTEASELDGYAPFDYDAYAADPESFEDSAVRLEGVVAQLLTAQEDIGGLILTTADGQRVYVEAAAAMLEGVSGGDSLCVYARISGVYEYNTITGQARSIPRAVADSLEVG